MRSIGAGIVAIAVLASAPAALAQTGYVANRGDNTLSIINGQNGQISGHADLAMQPSGIAITPDGQHVYLANEARGVATVIRAQSGSTLVNDIEGSPVVTGTDPRAVAIAPNGKAYVVNHDAGTVSIIDTTGSKPVVLATVPVGLNPTAVAITPDGAQAWVAVAGDPSVDTGELVTISTATNDIVNPANPIEVCTGPTSLAMTTPPSSGPRAYVACTDDNAYMIDVNTRGFMNPVLTVPGSPTGVAATPDGTRVFVTNADDSSVSVFDTTTSSRIDVPVGSHPSAIAITPAAILPNGPLAYVTNADDDSVSVLDTSTATPQLIDTLSTGADPGGVAITPVQMGSGGSNGYIAYVANSGDDTVSAYFTKTGNPVTSRAIDVGARPDSVAIGPDGSLVYASAANLNAVFAVNTSTNAIGVPIPVGHAPEGVSVSPAGDALYSAGFADGTVSAIDTASGLPDQPAIGVETKPIGIAVTPDGGHAFVANFGDDSVSALDLQTGGSIPIAVGDGPSDVAVTPSGNRAYVTEAGGFGADGAIQAINTQANPPSKSGAPIQVGAGADGIAISPDATEAYVANSDSANGTVTVIDLTQSPPLPVSTIVVGGSPQRVAFQPDGSRAYVSNASGTVAVIDTGTRAVLGSPASGLNAQGIAFVPNQVLSTFTATDQGAQTFSFSATGSSATAGISSYIWDFGDSSTFQGPSPTVSHTYAAAGDYTVTLKAVDANGCASTIYTGQTAYCSAPPASAAVHVTAGPGPPGPPSPPGPPTPNPPVGSTTPPVTASIQFTKQRFRGHEDRRLRVRFTSNLAGRAKVTVLSGRKAIEHASRGVGIGPGAIRIKAPAGGSYRLRLQLFTPDGQIATATGRLLVAAGGGSR
jgi:YVTN family beta-propeller protein